MQNIYFVDNKLKSRLLLQYSYSWDNRKNQNASLALMENFSGECQEQILNMNWTFVSTENPGALRYKECHDDPYGRYQGQQIEASPQEDQAR